MEILRFTLSGRSAIFRKPEVNSYVYFTYGNIHKVALLGMFGALLGYKGYTQMQGFEKGRKQTKPDISFPEFYQRLNHLNISILPSTENKKGVIPKKVQAFNNSVGYASKEQGGNLIVKEQWLENPKWEICVLIDSEEARKVKDAVCDRTCVYYPYLGKNDHPADISRAEVDQAREIPFEMGRMDCFVPKDNMELADLDYDEKEELGAFNEFKYEEALPWALDGWTNLYILKTLVYTDAFWKAGDKPVYELRDGKRVVFY